MPKYTELPAFREQNFIAGADGDMPRREARALALRRIEESARTEADFENVLSWWDKLDANREQKEQDHMWKVKGKVGTIGVRNDFGTCRYRSDDYQHHRHGGQYPADQEK